MSDVHFTYADPTFPLAKRALIRAVEILTGQPKLKRLYLENRRNPVEGESFFSATVRRLELDVRFDAAALAKIPAFGPCVIVANHPYGVLDGIVMGWLIEKVRRDFVILTHALLLAAPEARGFLLPVDFSETPEARATNLATRSEARRRLEEGGCVVVFPAGGVSTSPDKLGRAPAVDAPWQLFTAQLIQRSNANVVPLFFGGQNSRMFQIASHVNQALRLSLIFKEVHDRIGTALPIAIGEPIASEYLARFADRKAMIDMLRQVTYRLGDEIGGRSTSPSRQASTPDRAPA